MDDNVVIKGDETVQRFLGLIKQYDDMERQGRRLSFHYEQALMEYVGNKYFNGEKVNGFKYETEV
jgi:hypothetical protein